MNAWGWMPAEWSEYGPSQGYRHRVVLEVAEVERTANPVGVAEHLLIGFPGSGTCHVGEHGIAWLAASHSHLHLAMTCQVLHLDLSPGPLTWTSHLDLSSANPRKSA